MSAAIEPVPQGASTDAAAQLLRHVVRVAEGTFDASTCQWLQDGIARWLNAADRISLEEALGLSSGRGGATVRATLARARRDHWLRVAWQEVTDDATATHWQRSVLLAEEIAYFEQRGIWERLQKSSAPLDGLVPLRVALFHAFASGAMVPRTATHIDQILKSSRCSDLASPPSDWQSSNL